MLEFCDKIFYQRDIAKFLTVNVKQVQKYKLLNNRNKTNVRETHSTMPRWRNCSHYSNAALIYDFAVDLPAVNSTRLGSPGNDWTSNCLANQRTFFCDRLLLDDHQSYWEFVTAYKWLIWQILNSSAEWQLCIWGQLFWLMTMHNWIQNKVKPSMSFSTVRSESFY